MNNNVIIMKSGSATVKTLIKGNISIIYSTVQLMKQTTKCIYFCTTNQIKSKGEKTSIIVVYFMMH